MIQAQIYREWGVAIVKGRAECLLALLECTVPTRRRGPRSPAGSRGTSAIERANAAIRFGGFAERGRFCLEPARYAVMKARACPAPAADESGGSLERARRVSPKTIPLADAEAALLRRARTRACSP